MWEELWWDSLQVCCEVARVAVGGWAPGAGGGQSRAPPGGAALRTPGPGQSWGSEAGDAGTGGGVQAEALGGRLVRGAPLARLRPAAGLRIRASWPRAPPARPHPRRSAGLEVSRQRWCACPRRRLPGEEARG